MYRLRYTIWVLVVILFSVITAYTQGECGSLVERALTEMGDNCSDLGRNSACYGFNRVNASFTADVEEGFFSHPADFSSLKLLETIRTASLNTDNDEWGVAVLSVQANVPNTLPGQAVTFILLGDVEVENGVDPDDAFVPIDPIPATTLVSANIRTGPGTNFNVVTGTEIGTTIDADGLNEDGTWVRVVHRERAGWIFRELLEADAALDELPTITDEDQTPMQAFFLQTGIGEADCEEAPEDVLLVQGPDNLLIDLTVNGADITLGSTILIRIIPPGDRMEITVIDGTVTIYTPNPVTLHTGQKSSVCLSEPGDHGIDSDTQNRIVSCDWTPPEPLTQEDLDGWCVLGDVPLGLLSYRIPIECDDGLIAIPISFPPTGNTTTSSTVGCAGFRLTSPIGGSAPAEDLDYYWDPAPGATSYLVRFYDPDAGLVATLPTDGPETTIRVNTGTIGVGGTFQWEVLALLNGEVICSTGLSAPLTRNAPIDPIILGGDDDDLSFPVSWLCTTAGEVTIYYAGLPIGTTSVVINFDDSMSGPNQGGTFAVPPFSGSQPFSFVFTVSNGSVTAQPSGATELLPGILNC